MRSTFNLIFKIPAMNKTYLLTVIATLLSLNSNIFAQQFSINGTIKDNGGTAVAAATISLLSAKDSSWIKSEIAGDSGIFELKEIAAGNYIVVVTAIGFDNVKQAAIVKDENVHLAIVIQKSSKALTEVTVSGKKPFLELGMGKVVVNIENSVINSGTNVLEVLRRSPGVQVDSRGNISLHGKSGVLVLIDDRPTYMTSEQLADYLKNMNSDEVAQLELITQPSAKYDAEGNSGIINIKTKKSHKKGLNGNLSTTAEQGVYGCNYGSGRIDYYKNKLRLFTGINYIIGTGYADWKETDHFKDAATGDVTNIQFMHSMPKEHFSNTTLRIGGDYAWNNKVNIGGSVSSNYHPNAMHTKSYTEFMDAAGNPISYSDRFLLDHSLKRNLSCNTFLKYTFNKDSDLDIDLDYIVYDKQGGQNSTLNNYDTQMQAVSVPTIIRSNIPVPSRVYSAKADYSGAIGKIKIEAGLKSSLVAIDYNPEYEDLINNVWIRDTGLSNRFFYTENINAAYISGKEQINDRWSAQAGLRAENANTYGHQYVHDEYFKRNAIALFPTAFVSYKPDTQNQFELNYGRRVNRPEYSDLNPFIWYTFYNNYKVGNPDLQPEYTHKIELKHSYKNMLITSVSYSNTLNGINYVTYQKDTSKTLYWTPQNIANNESVNFSMTFNKLLLKWWNLSCSADAYYEDYNGQEGSEKIHSKGFGSYFSMDSQFTISKEWAAELNAFYSGEVQGLTSYNYAYGVVSFGVSKKVFKDAGSVKLSVYDPFRTGVTRAMDSHNDFYSNTASYFNSLGYAGVSFNYKFGSKKGNTQQKDMSPPEESRRM